MGYAIRALIVLLGNLLPLFIRGSSCSSQPKGFGFQKEHDGSVIGMEDGVQQIKIAGRALLMFCELVSVS